MSVRKLESDRPYVDIYEVGVNYKGFENAVPYDFEHLYFHVYRKEAEGMPQNAVQISFFTSIKHADPYIDLIVTSAIAAEFGEFLALHYDFSIGTEENPLTSNEMIAHVQRTYKQHERKRKITMLT